MYIAGFLFALEAAWWIVESYVNNRNYPDGPLAYANGVYDWTNYTAVGSIAVLWAMSDGLLIWRCWVVWNRSYAIIAFPVLLYLTCMGLVLQFAIADEANAAVDVAYWSCALALNVVVTGLITFKLLQVRRNVVAALGKGHGQQHISVASVMIESGALISICSIFSIASFASPFTTVFGLLTDLTGGTQAQLYGIAPQLILIRVASGLSYSGDEKNLPTRASGPTTGGTSTSVAFAFGSTKADSATELSPEAAKGSDGTVISLFPKFKAYGRSRDISTMSYG